MTPKHNSLGHDKTTLQSDLLTIDTAGDLAQDDVVAHKVDRVVRYLKVEVKRSPKEPAPNTSRLGMIIRLGFWAAVITGAVFLILSLVWRLSGDMRDEDWGELLLLSVGTLFIIAAPLYMLGYMLYSVISGEYVERAGFINRVKHNTHYALELKQACGDDLLRQILSYLKWQIDTQSDLNAHVAEFLRGASILFLGWLVVAGGSPETQQSKSDLAILAALGMLFVLFIRSVVTSRLLKLRLWLSIVDQAIGLGTRDVKGQQVQAPETPPSIFKKLVAFLRLN